MKLDAFISQCASTGNAEMDVVMDVPGKGLCPINTMKCNGAGQLVLSPSMGKMSFVINTPLNSTQFPAGMGQENAAPSA